MRDGPDIQVAGKINLTHEIENVLRMMFKTFSHVAVEAEFGRGFSGSRTFRIRLIETGGKTHLPTAVKIASAGLIREEWQAYQTWVKDTLPYIARLETPPIFPADSPLGGLHYALVGGGVFAVQSLHDYYRETTVDDLCWVFENRLFEIMGSNWWLDNRTNRFFQMQADYDRLLPVNLLIRSLNQPPQSDSHLLEAGQNLLLSSITAGDWIQLKGFVIVKVDLKRSQLTLNLPPAQGRAPVSYRLRLTDVAGIDRYRAGEVIDSIYGQVIATRYDLLCNLVRQALGETVDLSAPRLILPAGQADTGSSQPGFGSKPRRLAAAPLPALPNPLLTYQNLLQNLLTVNISTVHGDLNLENVLIDPATREVSLIDFATVSQGHALHDLLRLETEVVIMLIPPVLAQAKLPPETIYPFYEQLHQATQRLDQATSPQLPAALAKPFQVLRVIRKMARKCLFDADDWQEYYQGLVLYLLGALKFENLKELPTAPLPGQTAFWGAATAQHLLETPLPRPSPPPRPVLLPPIAPPEPPFEIEPPFGTMRPDSKFYIERPADEHCRQFIAGPHAATLFAQAPMQMGKSSLMRRMLYLAGQIHHTPSAFIDFQKFAEQDLAAEEKFFTQFCLMLSDALSIPEAIDRYWSDRRSNIMKCSLYLSEYLIPRLNQPFILAMDEVERMLSCPFRANFFGMLRTWHNDRVYNDHFAKMTLFLSSSTDPFLLIDNPYQSPFNVATLVRLEDFSLDEVYDLNRRHGSPLDEAQVNDLMDLVNGHPFLTRLALYEVALGEIELPALLARATDGSGPFGEHLQHYWLRVLPKSELRQALRQIVQNESYAEDDIFYRLKGAGLIKKEGKRVVLRNKLYERYFKERLNG